MHHAAKLWAWSAPLFLFVVSAGMFFGPLDTSMADLAGTVVFLWATISAAFVGIALFLLKKRDVRWWQGLLLSIVSYGVALGVMTLYARMMG